MDRMDRVVTLRRRHRLFLALSLSRQRVYRDRENPLECLDDGELQRRFRFTRDGIFFITSLVALDIEPATRRSQSLPSSLQVLLTLQFLATGNFLITAGDVVNVHEATACRVVHRVVAALCKRVGKFVRWPRGEEIARAQHQFYQLASFPGVVGAVDGTHVRIQAPSAHETAFVNRKNYHSINVQLIAGADCKILDVVANWPGATHDSRILRESTIGRELEAGVHTGLLLGDSGYPCKRWLMTPFLQPRNRAQEKYNASHSTTRALVERTIGQLKRRFHCLHSELRVLTKHTCPIIVACCVLHNIAKDFGSEVQEADSDNDHDPDYDPQLVSSYEGRQDGFMYRDAIVRQHFT
ncbi:putative nuclease HARBI1 [Ornithodoros turicata]|uniref:putative nuclease HARBI1 n=1 Tax=Ornithodoros turicata TaxID=34597 RepID=UPI0031389D24